MVQVQRREGLGVREHALRCLQHSTLFGDVTLEELKPLAEVAHRYVRQQGELLDGSAEEDSIFVVVRGGVRLYLLSPEGRELTFGQRASGELFQLNEAAMPGEAIAEAIGDDTVLYALTWARFLQVLASSPAPSAALVTLFRRGYVEERRLVRELAFCTVKMRLAHILADLARNNRWHVVTKTHEELAALAGTRPEEVTKVLRRFREQGLLSYPPYGRVITVINPDQLLQIQDPR